MTGGWYDAGDHGKYVVNGGIAAAQLMQEYERTLTAPSADRRALGDSTLRVPEQGNRVPDLLDEVRWELEWFLTMQVQPGRPLAGMVLHEVADANWTGVPQDPSTDPQARVLYRPSTAATPNVAGDRGAGLGQEPALPAVREPGRPEPAEPAGRHRVRWPEQHGGADR